MYDCKLLSKVKNGVKLLARVYNLKNFKNLKIFKKYF